MARLVRAIHVFLLGKIRQVVDGPHKAGHDDGVWRGVVAYELTIRPSTPTRTVPSFAM
ncbi:hypothetical protein GJW-30_1_02504 [Variibacter gotjawalensis]|uniref:Uncharacterized protein n=1 Tax=Variibacter gotjawalensis TaxID=1333996 RepID=A0A0S3PVJ4_9BRAD|nr:hypothetical protein GJW-30_1_02504 [Variibacter gotjawalensis]